MKHLFLLLTVLLLLGCKQEERIPEDKLSKEEMVELHIEFHLAEAKVRELRVPIDSGMMLYRYLKQGILQERDLNDSLYEDSYQWYLEHPVYFQEVYEQVIDSLKYLHEVVIPAKRKDPKAKDVKPEPTDPDEKKDAPRNRPQPQGEGEE